MCAESAEPGGAASDDDVWGDNDDTEEAEKEELSREWRARREQFWNVCPPSPFFGTTFISNQWQLLPLSSHVFRKISPDYAFVCAQSGYREGIEEGKGETVQQGFNRGAQPCIREGFRDYTLDAQMSAESRIMWV